MLGGCEGMHGLDMGFALPCLLCSFTLFFRVFFFFLSEIWFSLTYKWDALCRGNAWSMRLESCGSRGDIEVDM